MKKILITSLLAILLSFSANAGSDGEKNLSKKDSRQTKDCFEGLNRATFSLNQGLDKAILKPTAQVYGALPLLVKTGVGNVLSNLSLPVTFINQTLQGNIDSAGNTLVRLSVNSTIGLIGIFDVATGLGFKQDKEDFGQTLAIYGVGSGPYIFLPILGPGNPRDLIGRAGDTVMNPVYWAGKNDNEDDFQLALSVLEMRFRKKENTC